MIGVGNWVRCDHCKLYFAEPDRPRASDPSPNVPSGFRPVFHLCGECAHILAARKSEIWGWWVPSPSRPATTSPATDG